MNRAARYRREGEVTREGEGGGGEEALSRFAPDPPLVRARPASPSTTPELARPRSPAPGPHTGAAVGARSLGLPGGSPSVPPHPPPGEIHP